MTMPQEFGRPDRADPRIDWQLVGEGQYDAIIAGATRWLLASGIQNHSANEDAGGFHAWYDTQCRRYPYLYAEATGYAITLLASIDTREARDAACAAGDWLLRRMLHPTRGFRCLVDLGSRRFGHKQLLEYAFDNGVILNGLANLHRLTGEPRYLETAHRTARWLVDSAQRPDGGFHPVFDGRLGRFVENEDSWSTVPGAYHAKIGIGLRNVGELTGDARILRGARAVCDFAMEGQGESGLFRTSPGRSSTNSHPHCYAAEGLWAVGELAGVDDYLNASAQATRWVLERASGTGRIPRWCVEGGLVYHQRVDTLAQVLRLAVIHLSAGRLPPEYQHRVHRLAQHLVGRIAGGLDFRAHGGFYFGESSDGSAFLHVNSWVTLFATQALRLYRDFCRHGKANLTPTLLV